MRFLIFRLIISLPLAFAKPLLDYSTSSEPFASGSNDRVDSDTVRPIGFSPPADDSQSLNSGGSDLVASNGDNQPETLSTDPARQEKHTLSEPLLLIDLNADVQGGRSSNQDVQLGDSDFLTAQGGARSAAESCRSKGVTKVPEIEEQCEAEEDPQCEDPTKARYCCNSKSPRMSGKQVGCTPCLSRRFMLFTTSSQF